jgi:hypothetical protein
MTGATPDLEVPGHLIQNALLVNSSTKIEPHGDLAQRGIGGELLPSTREDEPA